MTATRVPPSNGATTNWSPDSDSPGIGRAATQYCKNGVAPEETMIHFSHFFMTIVVPLPTSDTISNSSISRLAPGNPMPSPCDVV